MRAMLNEAMVNDWILVNPFKKVRPGELISIADERKRETILTTAEEKILLAACATERRRHLRALVIAALDTGARQGELLKLRWPDIGFDEGVIKNVTSYKGKTVQRREVPLTARLKAALLDLREKRSLATFRCSGVDAELRNSLIHVVGNLTLLTKKLNPSVSNGPWDAKRKAILKHSAIALNRYFHEALTWTEDDIARRTDEFFQLAL